MDERAASSAIVWRARILGPHPSDPGSSPGGGIFTQHARCCQSDRAAGTLLQVAALKNTRLDSTRRRASCLCLAAWLASQPERDAAPVRDDIAAACCSAHCTIHGRGHVASLRQSWHLSAPDWLLLGAAGAKKYVLSGQHSPSHASAAHLHPESAKK